MPPLEAWNDACKQEKKLDESPNLNIKLTKQTWSSHLVSHYSEIQREIFGMADQLDRDMSDTFSAKNQD